VAEKIEISILEEVILNAQYGNLSDLIKLIEYAWVECDRKKHHDWYWELINECDSIDHKVHFAGHRNRLFMDFCDLFDKNVNALFHDNNNLINVVINSIINQTVYKDSSESDFKNLGEKYNIPDYYISKLMQYSNAAMGLGFALNEEQDKLKKNIRNCIPSRMPLISVNKVDDINFQYTFSDTIINKYALSDYWPGMTYRMYLLGKKESYIQSYDYLFSSKSDRRDDFDVFMVVLWDWALNFKDTKKIPIDSLKKYCVELVQLVANTNLDIVPQFAEYFGLKYLSDSYNRIGTYARDAKNKRSGTNKIKIRYIELKQSNSTA